MKSGPADRCNVPQAFWRALERMGLPASALLRQAKLPGTLHLGGKEFISTAHYFDLWRALGELTGDMAFGLKLVQGTETAAHPPSSLAAFYARDFKDALHRTARFKHLCTPEEMEFTEKQGACTVAIKWLYAPGPEPGLLVDVAFASLVELGRRGTGQHIRPIRVDFSRQKPEGEEHSDYFACPIRWGAPSNSLVLAIQDLDRPFPGHNPELLDLLTPALSSALIELHAMTSTRDRVKVVLKRMLASGRPELSDIAHELAMSERTLQRRITDEGTTYRALLVEARQELGRQLLSDKFAGVNEVAYLLGFQDSSSFYRAFRDWEGVTPSRWRELRGN